MGILLELDVKEAIEGHGEQAFPEECCGLMLGKLEDGDLRRITEVVAMPNTFPSAESPSDDTETKKRRFLIDPKSIFDAEKQARAKGLDVLGIYHSHPNHPSQASEFDRAHAMPFWSYVIVSIMDGTRATMQSWRLRDDRSTFDEEELLHAAEG